MHSNSIIADCQVRTSGVPDPQIFQSQESSMMWAQKIQRDSTNMASVTVKPMFGFGKAPNTAGGY